MDLVLNGTFDPHMLLGGGMSMLLEVVHAFMTMMGVANDPVV